jgi:hypothetical protein
MALFYLVKLKDIIKVCGTESMVNSFIKKQFKKTVHIEVKM